jgi:predicted ATPase/DNA-binding SARP family transcriptional activator
MTPHLEIRILGLIDIRCDGVLVGLRYDKLRALLAYLAVEARQPHAREALIGLLWPDAPETDARRNLSQALFNLRQALGDRDRPGEPFFLADRESIQLNPQSNFAVDVARFERLLAEAAAHRHGPEACPACVERWREAVALYRGDFLQSFYVPDSTEFEAWALLKREALRGQVQHALSQLTAYHEHTQDYARGLEYARRQLALEPWREEAHRDLMRLLARSGQRSAALAQYEAAGKLLASELGVPPAPETDALLAQIKAGQWDPTRPAPPAPQPAGRTPSLPLPLTAFVGREHELSEVAGLLADPHCRLLTLIGPGGMGKTRLALQAATAQAPRFTLGATWVPLGGAATTAHMVTAIVEALGIVLPSTVDPIDALTQKLQDRPALLVLDNFEQLLADPESVVWLAGLIRATPDLKLLVTSREALQLPGEWVLTLEGLGASAPELFTQAARRLRAGFELSEADLPHVTRICHLVGATPLAIELAASWVRVLSCAEIAEELSGAFSANRPPDVLATQARGVPERHRSLAAVFEHSWQLLTAPEQAALGRLSVFCGGFTRGAAEQVAGATLATISALSAKSLLKRVGASRYELHPLVRQYAASRLAATPGEAAAAQAAHCAHFARFLADHAEPMRGSRQREAVAEVAGDFDNVQAAWAWAVAHGRVSELHQMGLPIYYFAQRRSRYREGHALLTQAIARLAGEAGPAAQEAVAGFLLQRGWLHIRLGLLDEAEQDFLRGQALFDRLDHRPVHHMLGDPALARGLIASVRGDHATATALYETAYTLIHQRADNATLAYVPLYLASTKRALGELAAAQQYAEQAHALAKQTNQPWVISFSVDELGLVAQAQGQYAAAHDYFTEAYALRETVGDTPGAANSLFHLGQLEVARGRNAAAREYLNRSLDMYRENGDLSGFVAALQARGRVAAADGELETAGAYLRQGLAVAHQSHFTPLALSILVDLGELLVQAGQPQPARQLARLALAQPASDLTTRTQASRLLERVGPAPEADAPPDLHQAITSLLGAHPPAPLAAA